MVTITAAFMELLSAYYMCDYIASTRVVSQAEEKMCSTIYTNIKQEISGLNPRDPKQNVEAYLIWKQWEKDNADLVSDLKNQVKKKLDTN